MLIELKLKKGRQKTLKNNPYYSGLIIDNVSKEI